MKILFAVSNENVSEAIKKQYQNEYKGVLTTKNVYYFNAIIKELQNDKTYDVIVINEDLEPFDNRNYDVIDKFLISKLTDVREETKRVDGTNVPIIFIMTDRHTPGDNLLNKLFDINIFNALIGEDRSITKVCALIDKPRSKEDAKKYYKISSTPQRVENEDDVKEAEIKNIIAHYKKLGKSEEKYVESFDNIASQYTDAQLKVIIRFLPLNVKAVLEERSSKYQEIMTFGKTMKKQTAVPKQVEKQKETAPIKEKEVKLETKKDVLLEQVSETRDDSPVVIPGTINTKYAKKLSNLLDEEFEQEPQVKQATLPGLEEEKEEVQPVEQPVKKGRGRPKKVVDPSTAEATPAVKKGRGRPKKVKPEEEQSATVEPVNLFDLDEEPTVLPGMESEEVAEKTSSSRETTRAEATILPGFDDDEIEELANIDTKVAEPEYNNYNANIQKPVIRQEDEPENYSYQNIESLVSKDKKIVTFIGTSKNGTSFLVNNLAQLLSSMNINTAILDMTKNRNSYYIYTQNDETLRKRAHGSIEKLKDGVAEGLLINRNLTVYTALPNEEPEYPEADQILKTLIQNYSLVLIDCDFNTPMGYFANSQEIYLVQSMDVLTIQPLTMFLRELKAKKILDQDKLRVVINKAQKVRGLNDRVIVGGLSNYNDPSMSYMTELFDKDTVRTCVIPFDSQVYSKYLGTLADCDLSLKGYPKGFVNRLKRLASMIYPLLSNSKNNTKPKYAPPSLNNQMNTPSFNGMDSTLNKMQNKY